MTDSAISRIVLIALVIFCTEAARSDEGFRLKVEPLLREQCFECHSHGRKMKSGLALDSRSGWQVGGDSGPAIIPGDPDKSLLIKMVRWADKDHQMPPENRLAPDQVAVLEEWVRRGAPDPRTIEFPDSDPLDWWSLKPLVNHPVPDGQHPIDFFIEAKMQEVGLKFSMEADRRTLARRVYVDLHGVLPTPDEVNEFEMSSNPKAWESLVEELMESPRYGEKWARHWLDVIHFADSHGCEHDVKRPNAWRFRDYVIDRLNADVSWGRFIKEQLAPDVFYPDHPELMAGLGFIAAGPLELSRAGTAPVTFDYLDRDDMVAQTMGAIASTTANCARCHDHKFDPVSQEDYYSLQAVFAGIGKGDIEFEPSREVKEKRMEMELLRTAAAENDSATLLQKKYSKIVSDWEVEWKSNPQSVWKILNPEVFVASGGATLMLEEDGSLFATGPMQDQEHYTFTSTLDIQKLTAIRVEALKDSRLPKGGPGRAENGNVHLSEVDIRWFPQDSSEGIPLKVAKASASFDQDGWTSEQAIDGDPKSGWAIFPRVNESHHIVLELDKPFVPGNHGKLVITLKQLYPPKHFFGKFRVSVTDAENGRAVVIPSIVRAGLQKAPDLRSAEETTAIAGFVLKHYANEHLAALPKKELVYGVSTSWSHANKLSEPQKPKVVHLLSRGDIEKPVREVIPGSISAIKGLPGRFELPTSDDESYRRAALADWLVHPDNPLTWRSIVNRVWQFHFGRGLCDTPNDFGRMGSLPTHPELLDWLALWFRDEAGGSIKNLHKLILTSRTWKQTSVVDSSNLDSDNRFLGRMNRRRMDAETYRDSTLLVSGRIDWTMGGQGIEQFKKSKGPQSTPELDYTQFDWSSEGAGRRSIYRVVWRGIPDPFMDSLDFPDMALLSPKRNFSVSPLQSLSLFNNDFVLEAAGWMADRLAGESNPSIRAVQLCWQREPNEDEIRIFQEYAENHGLKALCRILLNSNEFLFID